MAKVFDLTVYYYSDASVKGGMDKGFGQKIKWDLPLLENYNYHFIKNYSLRNSLSNRLFDLINPGVITSLVKEPSKIIMVNGWAYFSDLLTILTAKVSGKKVWLRAENPFSQEIKKSKFRILFKKFFLKHLLFRFFIHRFLYIGKENRLFFQYYGVKEDRLIYTPYSVDNDFFEGQYELLKNKTAEIKAGLNIPSGKVIILFSGKYIAKKRPLDLIKAFHLLKDPAAFLIMLGEGEMRPQMESYIRDNKMTDVMLTGFINQSEISKYYASADVFVMCSGIGETWGLSVNEAMNFGKPVIVSSTSGCSSDLVHHGENGYVYEEGDTEKLRDYLQILSSDKAKREKAGSISQQIIKDYSIQHIVENLFEEITGHS